MNPANLQHKGKVNIRNVETGKYINLAGGFQEIGTKVIQWHDPAVPASMWDLFWDSSAAQRNDAWEGLYFRSVVSSFWLNLTGGYNYQKPTQLTVWTMDDACRWRLMSNESEFGNSTPRGRIQSMVMVDNHQYVMNVAEASFDDEAPIIAWDDNEDQINTWELYYLS